MINGRNGLLLLLIICNVLACQWAGDKKASYQNKTNTVLNELVEVKDSTSKIVVSKNEPLDHNKMVDGKKEGLWKEFYRGGQLKSEGHYVAGNKEGLYKEWWKNGQLAVEANFIAGKENGLMTFTHDNGHVVGEGHFKNGRRQGRWKFYNFETGILEVEGDWVGGKQAGVWQHYYPNGQLKKTEIFENGGLFSKKCWDENGAESHCDE